MGIFQALLQQLYGLGEIFFGNGFLCQFYPTDLILGRNLSLTTFPGVEQMTVEFHHCLLKLSGLIQ